MKNKRILWLSVLALFTAGISSMDDVSVQEIIAMDPVARAKKMLELKNERKRLMIIREHAEKIRDCYAEALAYSQSSRTLLSELRGRTLTQTLKERFLTREESAKLNKAESDWAKYQTTNNRCGWLQSEMPDDLE